MTTSITFRTDADLKSDVKEILEDIGMNMSTALAIAGIAMKSMRKIIRPIRSSIS